MALPPARTITRTILFLVVLIFGVFLFLNSNICPVDKVVELSNLNDNPIQKHNDPHDNHNDPISQHKVPIGHHDDPKIEKDRNASHLTAIERKERINLLESLDILPLELPEELENAFPKPAPPLFLSLDNNAMEVESQLLEGLTKPNVYYFWCGKRWFEFRQFLSIVSVIRAVQPDKVLFFYEHYPPVDSNLYNLWIDDLKHDYEYFEMIKMKEDMAAIACHGDRDSKINLIGAVVGDVGGLYISESAWLLEFPAERRKQEIIMALDENMEGYLLLKGRLVSDEKPLQALLKDPSVVRASCSYAHHVYKGVKSDCVIVRGGKFETLYPMDYCYLQDDPFAKVVRQIFYNTDVIREPQPNFGTLVPNIGHMIWIGGGEMDYVFYLSLLSMLYIVKVDVVYIHGDQPPTGYNWRKINRMQHIRSRVKLITRDPPSRVYQGAIEPWYRALMSDIIRVDLMIKYGGVYTDTDAIWVKPLTMEERGYDAVATYDWVDWSYPYPDSVNFGVSYGKRNAPFYRLFRDSMRSLHNDLHGFTGVAMPYKILEKHPDLLRIDRRLGVICYFSRCHPLWEKDYHNMTHDHVVANSIKNWKEDVHAFHWTHPNPVELHNETILMQSSGIFAELGQYVLKQAGLWK